jgi:hypothetical protein
VHLGAVVAAAREILHRGELQPREQRIVVVGELPQCTGDVPREHFGRAIRRGDEQGDPPIRIGAVAVHDTLPGHDALDGAVRHPDAHERLGAVVRDRRQHRAAVRRESGRGDRPVERGSHHARRRAAVARDDRELVQVIGVELRLVAARERDPAAVGRP